jgi:hypothetical protein
LSPYNSTQNQSYSIYTFRPILIRNNYHNLRNELHRDKVAKYDPYAYALTYMAAEALTAETPTFMDESDEEVDIDNWDDFDDNNMLGAVIRETNTHGRCVLELMVAAPYWRVFSERHISSVKEDEFGNVIEVDVKWFSKRRKLTSTKSLNVPIEIDNVNAFFIEYDGVMASEGILAAVWDIITYSRYSIDSMAFFDNRMGSGAFFAEFDPDNIPADEDIDKFKADMDYLSGKFVNIMPQGLRMALLQQGNSNFKEHNELYLQRIVAGTGFPERFFTGEATGTLSTSDEDSNRVQTRLRRMYSGYKWMIKKYILGRYGIKLKDIHPTIGEALDEKEEEELIQDDNSQVEPNKGDTKENEQGNPRKRSFKDKILRRNKD